ncbi:hypothetical protein BH09DEP1_BH09DEP1_4320 [soil metagenome]
MILLFILLFSLSLSGMNPPPFFTVEINGAAAQGNLAQLQHLISKHGKQLDKESANVALWCALDMRQFEAAELLTSNCADVNVCHFDNETLLERMSSTKTGLREVAWLLAHGADPDLCAKEKIPRLAQLCRDSAGPGVLNEMILLCMHGADPNTPTDSFGTSCLYSLIHLDDQATNKFKMIALLIAAGADINTPRGDGITPLHTACLIGRNKAVAYLLHKGAKKDIKDRFGKIPFDCAKYYPDIYSMLSSDILPPMPAEAIEAEKELQKLKQKIA